MNYFEFHIGDYAAATEHLSDEEDLAYTRLLRAYYRDERPIPADLRAACRLARARTDAMREAVDVVLREFFVLEADGWHNRRADKVIAEYRATEPEREAKKANEAERQRRHREARREMFEQLRAAGVVPDWNLPMRELQALVTRHCSAPVTPVTRDTTAPVTPATDLSRVTSVTGHGYPLPTSHLPLPTTQIEEPRKEEGRAARVDPIAIAEALPSAVQGTWAEWIQFRREKRMPLSGLALRKQVQFLVAYPPEAQIEILNTSIRAGWQGLFAPKGVVNGNARPVSRFDQTRAHLDGLIAEAEREERALLARDAESVRPPLDGQLRIGTG